METKMQTFSKMKKPQGKLDFINKNNTYNFTDIGNVIICFDTIELQPQIKLNKKRYFLEMVTFKT